MRAYVINEFGTPSVFKQTEMEKPKIQAGHVLIKVMATSVNPVDTKIRSGKYAGAAPSFPAVLHGDVAGMIAEVGANVSDFAVGDEVYGCAGGVKGAQGALADFMLADARLIAKKPTSINFAEAAALPLVSITAWEALFEKAKLTKDQTILIHGGTGGVGHIALQLAKSVGAKVYTTVSSDEKAEICKKLGADEVINYREEAVEAYVKRLTNDAGFNVVFDTIGGENIDKSFAAVGLYGQVVCIQAHTSHNLSLLHQKSASLHIVFMLIPLLQNVQRERHGRILKNIAELVDEKKLKPMMDSHQFTFENIGEAHGLLESGKAVGKVVLVNS